MIWLGRVNTFVPVLQASLAQTAKLVSIFFLYSSPPLFTHLFQNHLFVFLSFHDILSSLRSDRTTFQMWFWVLLCNNFFSFKGVLGLSSTGHSKLRDNNTLVTQSCVLSDARFRDLFEVSKSNSWKTTPSSQTTLLPRELFLTMFYTINLPPLLVIKKGFMTVIVFSMTSSVHCL